MAIPEEFLEEIRCSVRLIDVIGRHTRLMHRGRELLGLCPFHKEKTPSFTVNETKGFFHCFGCGAHGSVFDFVMRMEGCGFRDAVERLAAEAGLTMPSENPAVHAESERRQSLVGALEAAVTYYSRQLYGEAGRAALDYLRRRGVSDEAIARFRLGFAPGDRNALRSALAPQGVDEATLIAAGLLIQPEDSSRLAYERFRERVMFPIADRRGRTVGFGGRLLKGGEPKYLNTPETPVFRKGMLLYGQHLAERAAKKSGTIIVVEGYMDVISLSEAGYSHAVAPLGTALTEDQLTALWRLAPELILCFDPDAAGQRAAERALEKVLPLMRAGHGVRFAFLMTDTGDDPDGASRRYPRQFVQQAISGALSLSDMLWKIETENRPLRTPEARAAVEARLRQKCSEIRDSQLRVTLLEGFRSRLRQSLRQGHGGKEWSSQVDRVQALPPTLSPGWNDERMLLAMMLIHPESFFINEEMFGSIKFLDEAHDMLRQALVAALSGIADHDARTAVMAVTASSCGHVADAVLRDPQILENKLELKKPTWTDTLQSLFCAAVVRLQQRDQGSGTLMSPEDDLAARTERKRASLSTLEAFRNAE